MIMKGGLRCLDHHLECLKSRYGLEKERTQEHGTKSTRQVLQSTGGRDGIVSLVVNGEKLVNERREAGIGKASR